MFSYCVWYTFKKSIFNDIVFKNAALFNTHIYPAHITIKSNIKTLKEANELAKSYKDIRPKFNPYGTPKQSHVKLIYGIETIDFYAIEQLVKVNGEKTDLHVSLAYKNTPFTDMEIAVSNENVPIFISKEDLEISVMNCFSRNPSEWFKLLH